MYRLPAAGFALLELLATIVLITVGVLGTLQIQMHGNITERNLLHRIRANALVEDVARKIDTTQNRGANFLTGFGAPSATANCWRTPCTTTERHRFHLTHWKCRLGKWQDADVCQSQLHTRALLPDGDGQIYSYNDALRITLRWRDSHQQMQTLIHDYVSLQR